MVGLRVTKLVALQHNCARGGQDLEAVLETAVRMVADLVLIQEPRETKEKDSTRSHASFTFIRGEECLPANCWIAENRASGCRVTELKVFTQECENHTQVVEVAAPGVGPVVIVNVYDRHTTSESIRPAQKAAWGELARHRRVVIAGDMNAHSKVWNPKTMRPRNNVFWEKLISEHGLSVWNTEEETRMGVGADIHSIIDLTLSSQEVDLRWSIVREQATGSDHKVIGWEIVGAEGPSQDTSGEMTGWDIRG